MALILYNIIYHWIPAHTIAHRIAEGDLPLATKDENIRQFVPDVEVINYFKYCPGFQERFVKTCTSGSLSCSGKCGTQNSDMPCSCKSFCVLQNNCCWDFKDKCPDLNKVFSDEVKDFVNGLNKTCEGGHRIIEGNKSEFGDKFDQFVIFDKETGLSYRSMAEYLKNKEVLIRFSNISSDINSTANKSTIPNTITTWGKKVLNRNVHVLNATEVEMILETGVKKEGIEIVNVAPPGAEVCNLQFNLLCGTTPGRGKCDAVGYVKLYNQQTRCEYYSKLQTENFQMPACKTAPIKSGNFGSRVFRQIVDISRNENTVRAVNKVFKGITSWDTMESMGSESTTRCSYGYEFIISGCYAPDHVVMTFGLSIPSNEVLARPLENLIRDTVKSFHQNYVITINDDWNLTPYVIDVNNQSEYENHYTIMKLDRYRMLSKQSDHLYTSEILSDLMENKNVLGNLPIIREMVFCLGFHGFNRKSVSDMFMMCDFIVKNATRQMENFVVSGIDNLMKRIVMNLEEGESEKPENDCEEEKVDEDNCDDAEDNNGGDMADAYRDVDRVISYGNMTEANDNDDFDENDDEGQNDNADGNNHNGGENTKEKGVDGSGETKSNACLVVLVMIIIKIS